MSLPLWVKALRFIDKATWYAYRMEDVARDELMRAWLDPKLRDAVTEQDYATQANYLPGGATFEKGLFDWEDKALAMPMFEGKKRLLLGAAGGGRELRVLCERGHEVVAFEPNESLRVGAEQVAAKHPKATVLDATYDDLVRAATEKTGPLASTLASGPFDAVILGWGSITHVLTERDHLALLRASRAAAPNGPLLLSFFMRPTTAGPQGKSDRVRGHLRTLFSALGASIPPDGLAYEMDGGFVYYFTEEEIHRLAFETGYEVAHLTAWPFPHAVLVPLNAR